MSIESESYDADIANYLYDIRAILKITATAILHIFAFKYPHSKHLMETLQKQLSGH